MFIFSLSLVILLAGSLPWVVVAKPPNKPAWLMALYLIASANVILAGYIANSFYALNQRWVVLAIHVVIGLLGWLIWQRVGQPAIRGPFQDWKPARTYKWIQHDPLLSLLVLIVTLFYGFALAQIVLIPQNNVDSLSTHLSRIGFWNQQGSFFPWPTFMLNQVWYPVNAQLQTYWTLLFLGSDHLVAGAQWLAVLVSGMGVFGMARFYSFTFHQSAFAALVFLSFPLVALQSTTTQTDLITTVYFILAVYFLFLGLQTKENPLLTLSAISIGIGLGVKKSYFLLLLVLVIMAILAAVQFGKRSYKQLFVWLLNLVIGISLFGAYNYVVNWRIWGSPFGLPAYVDNLLQTSQPQHAAPKIMANLSRGDPQIANRDELFPGRDIFLELAYNTPRLIYQALDTSGLPRPVDGYAHKVKMRLVGAFFHWIGFDEIEGVAYTAPGHTFSFSDKNINEESHAWFGPLSVLLLFPALMIETRRGFRTHSYLLLAPGVAILFFLPMEIILRPGWDPFQGRYFAPLVALASPLMAYWFKEKDTILHEWLIGGLAVVILFVTLLYNPSKPTLGKFAEEFHVWDNDRIFVQTIQRKKERELYYMVERLVPTDSTLGYYIPFFILEYPLFGENLTRRLVPVVSPSQLSDIQWLREHGINYLLLPKMDGIPPLPPSYQSIGQLPFWTLYLYQPTP